VTLAAEDNRGGSLKSMPYNEFTTRETGRAITSLLRECSQFFTAGKSCGKLRGKIQQENVKGKSRRIDYPLDERKKKV